MLDGYSLGRGGTSADVFVNRLCMAEHPGFSKGDSSGEGEAVCERECEEERLRVLAGRNWIERINFWNRKTVDVLGD